MAEINASIALTDEQVISVGVNPSFYRGESARPNFYFDEITSIPYGDTPSATVTGEYPNYYISMEIPRGADGDAPTIQVGNVTTGSTPSVTVREVEGVVVLDFVFPVPPMPNITIGTVQESSSPSVTISGTTANPILNFGLVKGDAGTGISSIELTSGDHSAGTTDVYTITLTDGTTALQEIYNGSDGVDGTDGVAGATGNGIDHISRTSGTGMAGSDDIYTIYYTNGTTGTFTVHNGSNGTGSGDMTMSVYDTDEDGIVDHAKVADALSSNTMVPQSQVEGLSTSLSGKANSTHTHSQEEITGQNTALNSKIVEPLSEGTSGQFLSTDGSGGRIWATATGSNNVHVGSAAPTGDEEIWIDTSAGDDILATGEDFQVSVSDSRTISAAISSIDALLSGLDIALAALR